MDFQSLESFLKAPFGEPSSKSNDFERSYKALVSAHRIRFEAYTIVDDNYLVQMKVGSESNKDQYYDVIIMFFTDDEELLKGQSLQNYYVKFFSNSPSFIYQYAVLYKQNGFLIDMLYDKMDKEHADTLPSKTIKMSYDKSIYSACRFFIDNRIRAFSKRGLFFHIKKTPEKFLADIQDFSEIKFSSELRQIDRKIDKEMKTKKSDEKHVKHKGTQKGSMRPKPKQGSIKSTGKKSGIHVVQKRRATKK